MNIKAFLLSFSILLLPVSNLLSSPLLQQQNKQQSVTLDIENMSCAMCQYTIKKALQNVKGVNTVKVDFESKTATVVYDPQLSDMQSLIQATTHAGYPSTIQQAE